MLGPELALAASAREWPDRVHRFLLDHGGGRVRSRVMGAEQTLASEFEVLLIDDICSFLTPRLIRRLRDQGREVIGVFSPEDGPDAKRRLLECGITDVIEGDATPEEFLQIVRSTLAHRGPVSVVKEILPSTGFRVGVLSAATGSGCTEVAVALAGHLAKTEDVVLLDFDQSHPGVSQRLDLPLHPNLRTAVDLAHHDVSKLDEALQAVGDIRVVGGLAVPAHSGSLPVIELTGLLEDLGATYPMLVIDLGEAQGAVSVKTDTRVVVAEASPVGLTRLVRAVEHETSTHGPDVLAVVSRVPRGGHRSDDIRAELASALPEISTVILPEDRRISQAAWSGELELRGPFARGVGRIAHLIAEEAARDG